MVKFFEHHMSSHCENGVTANILRYYGYEFSEPMIFGLSASLFFVHLPFVKMNGYPVTSFRPLPGMIFTRVAHALGFDVRKEYFFTKRGAVKKLDGLLARNIPVGAVADTYYLPYMPETYHFHFNVHSLCVIGKEGGEYLISDPLMKDKTSISGKDFLTARYEKCLHLPMGELYWVKSLPEKIPDLKVLIPETIRTNCSRMLNDAGILRFPGVDGMMYLSEKIPVLPERYGKRKAALFLLQFVRTTEELGTGGAGFRFMYASFLKESAGITGINELSEFSGRMNDIADDWRELCALASRIYKDRNSNDESYLTLSKMLYKIARKEKQFFTDLKNCLK